MKRASQEELTREKRKRPRLPRKNDNIIEYYVAGILMRSCRYCHVTETYEETKPKQKCPFCKVK
jgi:rubrerythrin